MNKINSVVKVTPETDSYLSSPHIHIALGLMDMGNVQ